MTGPPIGVALKAVALRPDVDPLTGAVHVDDRVVGASDMDRAALEWALRLGERWGRPVVAVSAGGGAAELVLRGALSVGASRAVHVQLDPHASSEVAAVALADVFDSADCGVVLCGAHSLDRGSGSVPAFLAHHRGCAQALGLVDLEPGAADELVAVRRLDGGRREKLRLHGRVVCSVEGSTARLRRAGLATTLAAGRARVEVVSGPAAGASGAAHVDPQHRPYRPRARVLPPPEGASALDRVLVLTQAAVPRTPPRVLEAPPDEAADAILAQLREWGELPGDG